LTVFAASFSDISAMHVALATSYMTVFAASFSDLFLMAHGSVSRPQPCVIKIHDFFENDSYIYILLELVSGALFDFIIEMGRIREPMAKALFYQMLLGVKVFMAVPRACGFSQFWGLR
jgi:serine/threonine protein kinase